MTALGRGFVAVYPSEAALTALEARLAPLRASEPQLRWARRDQWHCTLRFLGRVPDLEALVDAVGAAAASVPGVDTAQLAGSGAFPKPRHGSVLWVGFSQPDAFVPAAAAVERACVDVGFPAEPRAFRAHVTVARAARALDLRAAVDALRSGSIGPPWPADEIVVVSSDTRPDGAVYEPIARIRLGAAG